MEVADLPAAPTFCADPLSEQTHAVVLSYHRAWKRRDLDALMALFHPAVIYHDVFQNRRLPHAALRDYLAACMPQGEQGLQTYTDRLRVDGDVAILQYEVSLRGSAGRASFSAIEALTVRNGLIWCVNDYAVLVREDVEQAAPRNERQAVSRLGLSARQLGLLAEDLLQYFEQSRPYLDPTLDLQQVASATGYTRNQISFFLNQVRGQTFYNFLNQLRLDEVLKGLRMDGEVSHIDERARAAGFNSLSTFYRCFKARTHCSPKTWLQQEEARS